MDFTNQQNRAFGGKTKTPNKPNKNPHNKDSFSFTSQSIRETLNKQKVFTDTAVNNNLTSNSRDENCYNVYNLHFHDNSETHNNYICSPKHKKSKSIAGSQIKKLTNSLQNDQQFSSQECNIMSDKFENKSKFENISFRASNADTLKSQEKKSTFKQSLYNSALKKNKQSNLHNKEKAYDDYYQSYCLQMLKKHEEKLEKEILEEDNQLQNQHDKINKLFSKSKFDKTKKWKKLTNLREKKFFDDLNEVKSAECLRQQLPDYEGSSCEQRREIMEQKNINLPQKFNSIDYVKLLLQKKSYFDANSTIKNSHINQRESERSTQNTFFLEFFLKKLDFITKQYFLIKTI